jgi:hypothetical protein
VEGGRCVLAFRYEIHRDPWFVGKPAIERSEVADSVAVPAGLKAFTLYAPVR